MTWDDHAGFRLRSPPNLFATSITTYLPPYELFAKVLPDNPHVKFFGLGCLGRKSPQRDGIDLERLRGGKRKTAIAI